MSVKRLILDSGVLDQDRIIGTGTVVLNERAVLDSNIIAGTGYNSSTSYNDLQTLYNGSKVVYDYADASLGGMSAFVESTPQIIVTATAQLGTLNSTTDSKTTHFVTSTSNLGSLIANADTTPTILPVFNAQLGSLDSSTNAIVTITAQASTLLSSLTAQATTSPNIQAQASAQLNGLTAQATATQPEPPAPMVVGHPYRYPNIKKKKVEETPIKKPLIINIPKLDPLVRTRFAKASCSSPALSAQAKSRIDFSVKQDEADLLLLL